jgi:polysaccharide export outer membrane protein
MRLIAVTAILAVLLCGGSLGGCSNFPSSGPTASEIDDSVKEDNPIGFQIVDVTPRVIDALAHEPAPSVQALLTGYKLFPVEAIGVGDTLSISIFEAGPGLFSHQPQDGAGQNAPPDGGATRATLPDLVVGGAGYVTIPYAGRVAVAGLTPEDAARLIERRFKGKSLQPQVVVNVVGRIANSVMIFGDVKVPGRLGLSLAHERLLDLIALAGGPTHPAQDIIVTIIRDNRRASVRLSEVYELSGENLVLTAGDQIELEYQPRTFLIFGATAKVSEIPFDMPRLSLAQGVARAGGPSDIQADPTAVYLFRYETPEVAKQLGLTDTDSPVVYRLNLMEPASYFAMQKFAMRDKDLIYIANARTNQLQKALNLFAQIVSPAVVAKTLSP